MSVITMTVSEVDKDGILDVESDANVVAGDDGDSFKFPNDGKTVLVVVSGTGDTFTFTARSDKYGRTEALAPIVAGAKTAILGPFLPELWNDGEGYIEFTPTTGNSDDALLAVRVAEPS
jgi:hypothetical protein